MKKLNLLAIAVGLLLSAAQAQALTKCYSACSFLPTSANVTRVTTADATADCKLVFADTGNGYALLDVLVPLDMPDAMEITGFRVDTHNGTASTGTIAWTFRWRTTQTGENFDDAAFPAFDATLTIGPDPIPTGTDVQTMTVSSPVDILLFDNATDCSTAPTTCRMSPLRLLLQRNTSADSADGTMTATTVCYDY